MAVSFDRTDLEFILTQIQLAESGQPPVNVHLAFGLREVAGTDNSVVPGQGTFGSADQPFPTRTTQVFQTVTVNIDGTIFDPNPGVAGDTMTTSYANATINPNSIVVDTAPRTISNLIVDISTNNPAAVQAAQNFGAQLGDGYTVFSTNPTGLTLPGPDGVFGTDDDVAPGDPVNLFIGNITPDSGLSAPFNSWMTFFGQFFDHGLDLINKGGAGTVFIPLLPDDPLYVEGSPTNFMVLTRATQTQILPGPDGQLGTADDIHTTTNQTTPFVDQNQTYTSHPSHQVFLRDYIVGSDGLLHSSGKLLMGSGADGVIGTGDDHGMATWGDVKQNALKLGIVLTDYDVGDVPLLATDKYGNFIPGPNGFAQVVVRTGNGADGIAGTSDDTHILVEGTAAGLDLTNVAALGGVVERTGHAFINDMAHTASPFSSSGALLQADPDSVAGGMPPPGTYDNELLDAHYIAGDGRANENIALTTVHEIFHDEHNRLLEQTKELIRGELAKGDTSFALNWVLPGADLSDGIQDNEWNGERLFQVAKFGTETQYQHLVFEEFARKVAPTIHLFGNTDIHLDAAIVSEFANAVYRFGHSMLDENVPIFQLNPDGTPVLDENGQPVLTDMGLIEAFTNPLAFASLDPAQIVQGTTHQIGSEIDEFVTGALRNNLLGLPLDLAALNIARGRDTGVAPLNLVRNEIYSQTHDTALKPYANWDEFRQFLKHDASIINFVAAYGTHASILGATTLEEKRAAALALVTMGVDPASATGDAVHRDAWDFMHSLGAYANDLSNPMAVHAEWSTGSITGLDNVDLWIGGLAEKQNLFGGLLGSTFNFIFETQLEALQDGDRLYYLPRIEGIHWGSEIEGNTFASMIMANTGAKHLPASIFLTPEYTVEAGAYFEKDADGNFLLDADGHRIPTDPSTWLRNPVTGALLVEVLPDGTVHFLGDDNFFGNTMVLGGTEGDDRLQAGQADDDTVWGDGGNDWIDGGNGNDQLFGGAGDDYISDSAGDDIIHGDEGNDTIYAGIGDDIVFGGDGDDFIDAGQGIDEVLGGLGNDIILGGEDDDELQGNEGDDWIEGGDGGDLLVGDQGAPTGQVPLIQGNDVLIGGTQGDRMQGFSGDDIMLGLGGFDKFEGRLGFDWASWEEETHGVSVDMERREFIDQPGPFGGDAIRDFFIETEAASGSRFDDFIMGTENSKIDTFNELSNVNLIDGLANYFPEGPVAFSEGNILFGGGGSDALMGRGGNDIIDGDARLHVALTERKAGGQIIREILYDQAVAPTFSAPPFLDLDGNPTNVNTGVLNPDAVALTAGDIDTAVFRDVAANYQISILTDPVTGEIILGTDGNPALVVTHTPPVGGGGGGGAAGVVNDGTDTLYNIERLQFADLTIDTGFITGAPVADRVAEGTLTLIDNGTPVNAATVVTVGDTLTFEAAINDFEGVLVNGVLDAATAGPARGDIPVNELNIQWQYQDPVAVGGAPPQWVNIVGATGLSFTPSDRYVGVPLRVVASFTDGLGVHEMVASAPTALVVTNPAVNHAPTVVTQVAQPGLPDTTAREDTPLGTATRPGIFLPLITTFTDDTTPANQLIYTATLGNGQPLETVGLAFTVLTDAAGLVTGGRITGTPLPENFSGPISIRVKATDAGGLSVTNTFKINVLPVNDGVATLDISGDPVRGNVLTAVLGVDPDGGPVAAPSFQWLRDGTAITGATKATFALTLADIGHNISVRASYVDSQGFHETVTSAGTDAVADGVNQAPVASPDSYATVEDIALTIPTRLVGVLGNDTDANNDPLTAVLDSGPANGKLTLLADGSFKYTPNANFTGVDSFVYHATDGLASSDPTTVTINVAPADDGPAPLTISGLARLGETLTAVLGTDPDGGPAPGTATFQWLRNGVPILGATAATYLLVAADVGAKISVLASYTDGQGFDDVATSAQTNPVGTVMTGTRGPDVLIGTAGADLINGAAGADTINGGDGNDVLIGGAGNDVLNGGDGDDVITGGLGNDIINGGAGNDTINYTFGDRIDTIDGGADFDTLIVLGTAAANTLDVFFDGTSITNFDGGSVINVESIIVNLLGGVDTLNYGATTASVTVDLAAGTATGFTSIAGIENVTGGRGNDILIGDDNANRLNGGLGDDIITGGGGNDTLISGNGNDWFIATINDGNDTYTGGANIDTYDLSGTTAAATVNLQSRTASSAQTGSDSLTGFENVVGSQGNDTITGTTGANVLDGFDGDDIINGGAGSDTLIGGLGNDRLTGGAGNDVFVFRSGFGADIITDFHFTGNSFNVNGHDTLDLRGLGITDFADLMGHANATTLNGIASTLIQIGTDSIILQGVTFQQLNSLGSAAHVGDFLFA
jgi:Ca2+-binding RTX toxin-like protein